MQAEEIRNMWEDETLHQEPFVRIEVFYCQGEEGHHREKLTVDLQDHTVRIQIWNQWQGDSEYLHRVPEGTRLFSMGLEEEDWFSYKTGHPEDVLPDPEGTLSYEIRRYRADGSSKTIRGSFDVEDLPSDYPDFIRAVREAVHLYQLPGLLRESICSYRRPRASDYIYCEVSFAEGFHTYHYRTEDRTIQEEDYVIVPVGKENRETLALVESVEYYQAEDVPWPLEKTKFILRKATADDLHKSEE